MKITAKQLAAVEQVRLAMTQQDDGWLEVKTLDLAPLSPVSKTLVMTIETGPPLSELTLAEIFCHQRAHLFIGPRGAISAYIQGKRRRLKAWQTFFLDVYEREGFSPSSRRPQKALDDWLDKRS